MRIAVSVTGKDKNSLLDVRFGRCNYFKIFDMESNEENNIQNKGQLSGGGAGIAAAEQIIDEKVDVVITGNVGPNAYKLLDGSDIKVYKCEAIEADKAIEMYKKEELTELKKAAPAHSGMGIKGGR